MFGFFRSDKCPVTEERRLWIEKAFLWLVHAFGEEKIINRRILRPHAEDFPVEFDGDEAAAWEALDIVAPQMEIDAENIELEIYHESPGEIKSGAAYHAHIFLKQVEDEKYSAGLYWGKHEDGKYHIGLEAKYLTKPESLIATLAHELAHIKLLGEERIKKNNESLTDLTTVVFRLGIFNANSAFRLHNSFDSYGWSRAGYLTQMDWGYALTLFAFLRNEKTPDWINFLTLNVKEDFKQSERFITARKDKILKPEFVLPAEKSD